MTNSPGHSPGRRRCVMSVGGTVRLEKWPEGTLCTLIPARLFVDSRASLCTCALLHECVHGPAAHTPTTCACSSWLLVTPGCGGALAPEAARGPRGEDTASAGWALVSLLGTSEDGSGGPAWAIGPGSALFLPIRAPTCQCPAAPPGLGAAPLPQPPRDRARTRRLCACVHLWAVRVLQEALECEGEEADTSANPASPAPGVSSGRTPARTAGGAALGRPACPLWVRLLGRLCTLRVSSEGGQRSPGAWYPAGASSSGACPLRCPQGPAASHTPER